LLPFSQGCRYAPTAGLKLGNAFGVTKANAFGVFSANFKLSTTIVFGICALSQK
jgi:hypothetical protein